DAAWARGDLVGATVHARTAARAYVPFAPHVVEAYGRLGVIAQNCEERGDIQSALFAWRAVRAAAIGSRSIAFGNDAQRKLADLAIARLSVASQPGPSNSRDGADTAARYASALAAAVPPRAPFDAFFVAGAALWVAAAIALTRKGADP